MTYPFVTVKVRQRQLQVSKAIRTLNQKRGIFGKHFLSVGYKILNFNLLLLSWWTGKCPGIKIGSVNLNKNPNTCWRIFFIFISFLRWNQSIKNCFIVFISFVSTLLLFPLYLIAWKITWLHGLSDKAGREMALESTFDSASVVLACVS